MPGPFDKSFEGHIAYLYSLIEESRMEMVQDIERRREDFKAYEKGRYERFLAETRSAQRELQMVKAQFADFKLFFSNKELPIL